MSMNDSPTLQVRIKLRPGFHMGPGKANLLEGIARTGSIAAAGRDMGMSYRRAWSLIEAMNAAFRAPVVSTSRGGSEGGGARLTETGAQVLKIYRDVQRRAEQATAADCGELAALMPENPGET